MTKKLPRLTWSFGWKHLGLTILGILLYAGLNWVTSYTKVGTVSGINVRPGVAIPIFFGFAFGPLVGFLTGMLGNLATDFFVLGYAHIPTALTLANVSSSLSLNYEIGNGLYGLIPGLAALSLHQYATTKQLLRAAGFILLAVVAGSLFAALLDPIVFPFVPGVEPFYDYNGVLVHDLTVALRDIFIPLVKDNFLNAVIIVPILLFNYERL